MKTIYRFRVWDGEKMVNCSNWAITLTGQLLQENAEKGVTYLTGSLMPPVMLFTGYLDVYGIEVFEGDIIHPIHDEPETNNWPVTFEFGCFTINGSAIWDYARYTKDDKGRLKDPLYELEDLEVVGNIYEENLLS